MVVPIVLSYHASQNGVGYSRAGVRRGWKSNFQEVVWERVSLQEVYGMENSNPTRKRYTFYKKPIETGRCMYCPLLIVYVKYNVTYFCGDVYFCWVRYIAAYWKSSNTFCLFPKQPAWCHVSPYSLERKTEGIEVKIRKTRRSYPGKKIPIELHKETYIKFGPLFAFAQGDKCHAGRRINPCYIVFKQWELYL